jgi:predicted amidophosphoribosyltransferase
MQTAHEKEIMAKTRPIRIPGRWREGYALDYQTISSVYLGDDEFGHPRFSTQRPEVGELLYKLKYQSDRSVVTELVEAAASFVESWHPGVDILVPVPASRARASQPVLVLGEALAVRLKLPFGVDWVRKTKDVPELKNVHEFDERLRLLTGAHAVDRGTVQDRRILLFDDLFRSGATMNSITEALYDQGGAAEVFALTITRSRSKV